jgi:hypothetical protein
VIPIPQIEHSDPKIHYIVGQFDLPVDDILPSFIEVNLKRSMILGLRDEIQDEYLESAKIVL